MTSTTEWPYTDSELRNIRSRKARLSLSSVSQLVNDLIDEVLRLRGENAELREQVPEQAPSRGSSPAKTQTAPDGKQQPTTATQES